VLLLPEAITLTEASDTLRLLKVSLEREAEPLLVVDGAQLRRFDSTALAVLLECRRLAEAWGKRFELHSLPEGLVEGCRLKRAIAKDSVLTYADVDLPDGRLADKLRAEQYRHFRDDSWLERHLTNAQDTAVM